MSRVLGLMMMLASASAVDKTCGDLKSRYRTEACCGKPDQVIANPCPYNFDKPTCATAGVQAPRDLSTGATGTRIPKIPTLNKAAIMMLDLANVHYHLGAEHKSDSYNDGADGVAYDAAAAAAHGGSHRRLEADVEEDGRPEDSTVSGRRLSESPRPGYMCPTTALTAAELKPYQFVHCTGVVTVGKSYEFHFVRSSAGSAPANAANINDGLGGAANGRHLLNPTLAVQAQVYQIVNAVDSPTIDKATENWSITTAQQATSKMYAGSTTGTSHTNSVCSPYAVTWHVDTACHKISAVSFDNMCKQMKDTFGLTADLGPHGSRILLDPQFVVPAANVYPVS